MPELLTGLGLFGLVSAFALGSLFCLLQPIWSLVDCVDSDRERETKVLVSVAIVCTWGLGSVVYGLFFTRSASLRRFTIVSTLVMFVITIVSVSSCVSGIATQARRVAERKEVERAETRQRAAEFAPKGAAADAVAPFYAILVARTSRHSQATALSEFTLAGAVASTARDVRGGIRHVAHDADIGRTFALTQHGFGALSPRTGEFIEIAVDPSLDFSWPKGLAWDPRSKKVVVMTSHVFTEFFSYEPTTSGWEKLPTTIRDLPLTGLAYVPADEVFYALSVPARETELAELQRFNRNGAHLGRLALSPPIPVYEGDDAKRGQLHHSSGKLLVLLPPHPAEDVTGPDRIFMIDPHTGTVSAHAAQGVAAGAAIE